MFFDDLLFPLLGIFEGGMYDLWDWATNRVFEPLVGLRGIVWVRRRNLRYQYFPRGWLPKT